MSICSSHNLSDHFIIIIIVPLHIFKCNITDTPIVNTKLLPCYYIGNYKFLPVCFFTPLLPCVHQAVM